MEIVLSNKERLSVILEGADGVIVIEWVEDTEGKQSLRVSSDLPDFTKRGGLIYDSDPIGPVCKKGCSNTEVPYCHCISCGDQPVSGADGLCKKCYERDNLR